MQISRRECQNLLESGFSVLFFMMTVLKSKLLKNDRVIVRSGKALSVPMADGRFCAASFSRGFLVKEDPRPPFGPWWSLVDTAE